MMKEEVQDKVTQKFRLSTEEVLRYMDKYWKE